ncbi:MAG: alpha/beta family hydrolase [Candidatus Nanopelagicales bacterium]
MAAVRTLDVETPVGPARLHVHRAPRARALLVLGHGAGRGTDTADLLGLARDLPAHGVAVVLVDQPWVLAGRRVAAPPPQLDQAWVASLAGVRCAAGVTRAVPLVVGGRSAGARVACRTAVAVGGDAVLLLAFPLVPPAARNDPANRAKAVAARAAELAVPWAAGLPVVVAQGERDVFGTAADVVAALPAARAVPVPGADHSLAVAKGGPDPAPRLLEAALTAVDLAAR